MKKMMGLIVSIALLAGMLVGCAETPKAGSSGPTNPASSETGSPKSANSEPEAKEWPRTYVDALGRQVVLEKKPERIALLFFRNFEHLFLLGESPIAATDINVLEEWESLAPYKNNEIADLGSIANPNIEKLLALDPDLIIAVSSRYESYGGKLDQIAPVVTVDSNENNWQGALREYGKILGKERKAEDEIARLENYIVESRGQLEAYRDKTFSVTMLADNQYWAFTTQFIFDKSNGLGLNPPSQYVDMSSKGEQISLERLTVIDPDYMFVADLGGSSEKLKGYLQELEKDAVWNSLQSVKNNHMFPLDSSIAAGGPLAIELGVKTIVENVLSQ